MEQAKHHLRNLKRQHFWVLSGLIVLISVATWFLTVRSLGSQRDSFQEDIESSYSSLDAVSRKPDHVNKLQTSQLIRMQRDKVLTRCFVITTCLWVVMWAPELAIRAIYNGALETTGMCSMRGKLRSKSNTNY